MNALLIWSGLPALAAVGMYVFRRFDRAVHLSAIGLGLALAALALWVPINEPIILRLWETLPAFRISGSLNVLGSAFLLDNNTRPALVLLYVSLAFWSGGSWQARTHRLFIPLSVTMTALMSAALGAENLPTGGLMLELSVLLCVPLLSAPGERMRHGVIRFLSYQTSGVCLVLFAEPTLAAAGVEITPDVRNAFFILLLGFALLLGVIPFHTWMPMIAQAGRPYSAMFVFFVIPTGVSILALDILSHYTNLVPLMLPMMRYGGALMVLTGGIGAVFEHNLGRIAGFTAVAQAGMTLLAVSLYETAGRASPLIGIYFAQMAPQAAAMGVWGLGLSILSSRVGDLSFTRVRGAGLRLPMATLAIGLANLSLACLPLLAGFPISIALWSQLGARSLPVTTLALLGNLGLVIAGLRSLAVLVAPVDAPVAEPDEAVRIPDTEVETSIDPASIGETGQGQLPLPLRWSAGETRLQAVLLTIGCLLLLFGGLFPQAYIPWITSLAIQYAGGGR